MQRWPASLQGCGRGLKSPDTRRNHEKTCNGPKKTREELQMESQASIAAVKAVCEIMRQPHKEFDASKLELHQACLVRS